MKESVERIVNNAMNCGMAVRTSGYILKFTVLEHNKV